MSTTSDPAVPSVDTRPEPPTNTPGVDPHSATGTVRADNPFNLSAGLYN